MGKKPTTQRLFLKKNLGVKASKDQWGPEEESKVIVKKILKSFGARATALSRRRVRRNWTS